MNSVAEWEEIHKSRQWGAYPDIYCVRQVKSFLREWKYRDHGDSLTCSPEALDVGCGAGANTGMMCDEGMDVYAFDSSATALDRMCVRLGNKAFFPHLATVEEFEPPHQFDFILDNLSITYLEHPPWERILSWLKPGGWLIHASFETAPAGTPKAWEHRFPGNVVERHLSWVDRSSFAIVVRKYVKPS